MPRHDLVLHGGTVITLDGASRTAEAVAVRNGRIVAVGAAPDVRREAAPGTRTIDLGGRTVIPGFYDSHAHMDRQGLKDRAGHRLSGVTSIRGIQEVVAEAAASTPAGEWIVLAPMGTPPHDYVSRGDQLAEGRLPTRHDLDEAASDHPVYIRAPWGWWSRLPLPSVANSAALARAGVGASTPAPHNVRVDLDADGSPSGLFLDHNYTPILEHTLFRCVPRFSDLDRAVGVRTGADAYARAGTTSVYEGHGLTPALMQAYREVHETGDLPLRVTMPLSVPSAAFGNRHIAEMLTHWAPRLAGRGAGDDMLRSDGICLDIGDPHVARILADSYPYDQWAGHFYQSVPHERFVELGVHAARLGIRVSCLICYDIERALRAYEAINAEVDIRDRRWVLVHLVEATRDQLRRIRELGAIVTITPNFLYMAQDRFGLDKLGERGIPIREALDMGITCALSTDNVPHSMLWTMWQALARWDEGSQTRLGESGLSREEALRLAVQSGHAITWDEDANGAIEPGRTADLVVLDGNPLTCDEDRIKELEVRYTFVGGKEMHGPRAEGDASPPAGM